MTAEPLYRVVVTDNLVCAMEKVAHRDGVAVAHTNLEAGTQLSENNLRNGRLDGAYYFADAQIAREFALLCLDFVKRMTEQNIERIEDGEFSGLFECANPHHGHD